MSIILQGSTSGSVTLQEPAVAGTTVLTLPAVSGTVLTTTSPKAGNVIQVVSTTKTDAFSSTSTSFTDITGLSVSITPTASSSKILVMYSLSMSAISGEYSSIFRMVRGSTAICIGDTSGSRTRATNMNRTSTGNQNQSWVLSQNFLDSPATTSSTTYKIQGFVQAGTFYVNRTQLNDDGDYIGATTSTITVMEIAA